MPAHTSPAPQPSKAGWGKLISSLGLYAMILGLLVAAMVAARQAAAGPGLVLVLASGGLLLIVAAWAPFHWPTLRVALARPGHPIWWAVAPVAAAGTFGLAMGYLELVRKAIPTLRDAPQAEPFLAGGFGWPVIVFCIAIVPAVAEEVAFRGVIQGEMTARLGRLEGLLVTSLLFMAIHLSPFSFPILLVLGLLLGLLCLASKSIYPCMIMHFTHNALVLVATMN